MDPSLMSEDEIARRGRVIVDPCYVCRHTRSAHVLEGVFLFEASGLKLEREIVDACVACGCLEYIEPPPESTDEPG